MMNKLAPILLATALLSIGCDRSGDSGSDVKSEGGNRGILVVAMGGYLSCPSGDLYSSDYLYNVNNLEAKAWEKGRDFKKIISCYDTSMADPSNLTIHFAMPDGGQQNDNVYSFMAQVEGVVNSHPNHDLYVIGHSHGGWLSLKLMGTKNFNQKAKFYASVDPISRTACSPQSFIDNTINGLFNLVNPCQQFPTDISGGEKGHIYSNTEVWKNYYQENTRFLHSGGTDSAGNVRKDYGPEGDMDPFNNAHLKIFNDGSIWGELSSTF